VARPHEFFTQAWVKNGRPAVNELALALTRELAENKEPGNVVVD
jgi:hypothetical protein